NTIRREAEATERKPSFLSAMKKSNSNNIGIIAEIKKASPSKGDIRVDLDPALYAETYTKAGARAISVLTESHYFKGSLKDLEIVCAHTDLPVLRKDFTISSYQIYEAKKAGASSILLITTILSKDQLKDYIVLVRELGMEPLVEITSEKEFETAYQCDAKIVDMNNRNLQTLETDLTVSKRIAAILPKDIIPVEASGIVSFADIQEGLSSNIFNFLVGESIVRAKDAELFIKELRNIT
ncbi:MAG: indole-3-glycerol phosphate synthase TrpC, partial [Proteobacteria bacterium]|nr:indole-3-glycerol phosphate synthase TrpC [Pseudomonadota bacterium]